MTHTLTQPPTAVPVPVVPTALLGRICVRPPYFALRKMHTGGGVFVAEAQAELPQGLALGPMRPGELSRHGAIAGLCAVALEQKDAQRRYYLATEATFTGFPSPAPYGSPVRFTAAVTALGKREAGAFVTATCGGERVATLDVGYSVLGTSVFERLNAAKRRPTRRGGLELEPVSVGTVAWHGNTGVCRIPALPAEMCAGHFDDFPAAPVALLMDQLAQIAERFAGRPSYIASGRIGAARLCWAGDEVVLSMTRLGGDARESRLAGEIASGGLPVGTMTLLLRH